MPSVEIEHISKSFGSVKAVDDVTCTIESGELFGFLGPNGAGKTTSLRCLLDIFKPDSGRVAVFGGAMSEAVKDRIGYMPEERGLYQDITLERCLAYLGSLKGMTPAQVKQASAAYLERFDLAAHKTKKVKELSKGMQQKAQVIATLLHQPDLLIVDEPFSGLDPLNTQLIKDVLREQHERGVTIILCSHQMNLVEELCQRIVLIDQGKVVLYGDLNEIRQRFSGRAISLQTSAKLTSLPGVEHIEPVNGDYRLHLEEGATSQQVLKSLVNAGIDVQAFSQAVPTLDEIFIRVVREQAA